jgi:hypothetical protein
VNVKDWDACTEAERVIALNRQKIIAAYDESGLPVKQFVSFYNTNQNTNSVLPEVKAWLGRWAGTARA